eukprot:PITA_36371
MGNTGKIEIEKFNGQSFELWKLKMEDLLVDKDQWIVVDLGTKPTGVSDEEGKILDRKAKSIIRLCVLDSILLNVSGEGMAKALWDKLGTLYQSKSLVNKLFLWKTLYNLRMKDGDSVTEHLNTFNNVVSQLLSVDIKISDEDKQIFLLCSLPYSWDSLVIAIGSNATALQFDEIVSSLLTKEMRRKNMESQNGDALKEGHYKRDYKSKAPDKGKGSDDVPSAEVKTASDEGGDVYLASSSTHVDHEAWLIDSGKPVKVVCWKCGKEGHYKRDCKSKAPKKGKGFDDAPSTEVKTSSDEGGDVYLASSSTHVDHEAWLIDSGASFHFTPHREWFCEYDKYDGGDVFLGDDRKARIVGHGKVKLKLQGGRVRTLLGVLHIPALARNLISISKLDDADVKTVFEKYTCKMVQGALKNRVSFPSGSKRAKQILELLHSDVFGPMKVPSLGKSVSPSSALEDKTRQEVWTGKKPSLSHPRVFGCDAYLHVLKEKRTKLDSKFEKCIFIGYKDGLKGYKFWNPVIRKVVYSQDVVFREVKDVIKHEFQPKEPEKIEFEPKEEESYSTSKEESRDKEPQTSGVRRLVRERRQPKRYSPCDFCSNFALYVMDYDPRTVKEAIDSKDDRLWKEAIVDEMTSLHKNEAWDLVELSAGRKPIGNKWVFKKKANAKEKVEKYKDRLVAKCYSQVQGIDFGDIFSPIAKVASIRLLSSIIVAFNFEVKQMDAKTTFLHGDLEEEIYMKQPEGFAVKGKKELYAS